MSCRAVLACAWPGVGLGVGLGRPMCPCIRYAQRQTHESNPQPQMWNHHIFQDIKTFRSSTSFTVSSVITQRSLIREMGTVARLVLASQAPGDEDAHQLGVRAFEAAQ